MDLVVTKRDLFTNLPEELTIDILGRLPSKSIMTCKSVCQSWLDLIEGGRFKTSYTPKSCLSFTSGHMYTVYDDEAKEPLFKICLKFGTSGCFRDVIDSADGLLLVRDLCNILFLANPMTCEYVQLPPLSTTSRPCLFGFGVGRISHQYKILCGQEDSESCHVYTLGGGGSWGSISAPSSPRIRPTPLCDSAAFLNGNLHWLFQGEHLICCFDLETELFTIFSPPPLVPGCKKYHEYRLCALEGQLCLCDCKGGCDVVIWKMNNYGDDNSWVQEYTFHLLPSIAPRFVGLVFPLKLLDNGDLLLTMDRDRDRLYIYSKNTENVAVSNLLQQFEGSYSYIITYTPSFLSLVATGIQNVQSLQVNPPFVPYYLLPRLRRKVKVQRRLIDYI